MKHSKTVLSMLMAGFGLSAAHAQQSVTSAGGEATGSGGTVSYSVGQVVYTNAEGSNGTLAQGVEQPFEISVILELEHTEGIKLNLSAYPNPTTDRLILKYDYPDNTLTYQLFDLHGRLLATSKLIDTETSIMMNNHEDGVYIVKVISHSKEIKTFKIIKKR